MWNPLGSQQLLPQVPGLYSQQHHHGLYGLPQTAPVTPHGQGLLQGFQVAPQATPLLQKQSSSTPQQQGMSSMTGISFLRPTEYTKYCQVEYAKKAKPENCNLVLYVWGYVAQILASKQGLISAMPEQEQIGRLQHLLHLLELCAMQSSATDFNSPAWLCAKNYSDRVYQDLDIGASGAAPPLGPRLDLRCIQQISCKQCPPTRREFRRNLHSSPNQEIPPAPAPQAQCAPSGLPAKLKTSAPGRWRTQAGLATDLTTALSARRSSSRLESTRMQIVGRKLNSLG